MHKCKSEGSNPKLSLPQYRTTPQAPGEKRPTELLGHPYRDLLHNLQANMIAANDSDQDFMQQNCLQMQKKHNARLDPKSQITIQMQLNEGLCHVCQKPKCLSRIYMDQGNSKEVTEQWKVSSDTVNYLWKVHNEEKNPNQG